MKIINWNIEWMNDWFVHGKIAFKDKVIKNQKVTVSNVENLGKRVANVIKDLNPDLMTIQEGPSDIKEMQLFVDKHLKSSNKTVYEVLEGFDKGAQKMYALVKKNGEMSNVCVVEDKLTKELRNPWKFDVDGDCEIEDYKFTRTPLIIEGTWKKKRIRIISLHSKSKYVHEGMKLWKNPNKRKKFVIEALRNRRRISSEAMRLRTYLNKLMEKNAKEFIVVTGDFNDGPGIDYFERYYLTHNITDLLLGSSFYPKLLFKHSYLGRVKEDECFTAIFDDFVDNIKNRKVLLDHILVSPALNNKIVDSGIAHKEYEKQTNPRLQGREKYPSDHRPVYLVLG